MQIIKDFTHEPQPEGGCFLGRLFFDHVDNLEAFEMRLSNMIL